jgi:mannose-6-phosphate isomerase-like protein (cupin superfamily)
MDSEKRGERQARAMRAGDAGTLLGRGVVYVRPAQAKAPNAGNVAVASRITKQQTGGAFDLRAVSLSPGASSPPLMRPEDTVYVILDGIARFVVDSRSLNAAPGVCLVIPQGIPHRWMNRTSRPVRMHIIASRSAAPSLVSKRASRIRSNTVTEKKQIPEALAAAVLIVPRDEGTVVRRRFGEQTVIKATEAETKGAYAVRENAVPAGYAGVPYHIHHTAEEAFYILEGQMTLYTPDGPREAPAGTFVLIPRGAVHAFANHGTTPLRWLTFISPAWVSGWIEKESELLPVAGMGEPDVAKQAAIYEEYGLELIGPLSPGPATGQREIDVSGPQRSQSQ